MTTNRTPIRRASRGALSSDQEMCLWLGCGRDKFPFEDEEQVREAWERHGARIMADHARGGRRPAAWWAYDAPEGIEFDYDTERSTLYEAGLLDADEAAALVEYWHGEFMKAYEPGFTLCMGEGPKGAIWLRGKAAREAHFEWCDLPKSLLVRWTKERRASLSPESSH